MKIKRFRGNITILTLFVLLASALMWVLVALYMKNFIRYSDEITSYEKTNYLAKAWTELGLAIVWSREVGLVYSIASWNLIKWNFECPFPVDEWDECPVDPKFSLEIDWIGSSYQNCESPIPIKPGLSAIIPLFTDSWVEWGIASALEEWNITNRVLMNDPIKWSSNWINGDSWKYWLVRIEWDTLNLTTWDWTASDVTKEKWNWEHSYLIAANPLKANGPEDEASKTQYICLKSNNKDIPQETVKIISIWYYNNRQLWTETLTTKALPTFLQWDNYIH